MKCGSANVSSTVSRAKLSFLISHVISAHLQYIVQCMERSEIYRACLGIHAKLIPPLLWDIRGSFKPYAFPPSNIEQTERIGGRVPVQYVFYWGSNGCGGHCHRDALV